MITTVGPFTGSKYQQFGLVMMMGSRYSVIDFLQCNDVRSRIDDNPGDSFRSHFFIHTDTAMNTIGHCPLDEPRFFAVRLQEVPLERKKKFGSGDPSPNRPHMEIRIFFIADADGTILP